MTHKSAWMTASALFLLGTSALAQMSPSSGSGGASQNTQGNVYASPLYLAGPQIPLTDVLDTYQLASASVRDAYGQKVGQVRSVEKSASGRPTSVDIMLTTATAQGKVVTVKASNLKFDPANKVVVAQLSSSELDTMPSAPSHASMSAPAISGTQPIGNTH